MPHFSAPDGCKIFYTTYGIDTSDPVVIFLNGTTQTTLYWGNHVPFFARRHGLVCYDARGQGQSDLGTTPISLNLHVADLKNLMVHLAVDRARLVGLSHGARLALEFALKFPDRIDRMVLCSIGVQTSDRCRAIVRSWLEILQRSDLEAMAWAALPAVFGNRFLRDHWSIIDKIITAVAVRNSKTALLRQLEAVLNYPAPEGIPVDFDTPTLVISGAEDLLVEPEDARQLAHRCRANHRQLAGIGHSIPAETPEIFQKLVLEFFDSSQ